MKYDNHVPLSWRRSTPLTMLAIKKELYGLLFVCMHMVVSIVMGLWFVTAYRALLENDNILTWLQGFQVKIENFFKFILSLNHYIKLMLIELVIKLGTNSFEMKWPLMGAFKSSVDRATGQCIFLPLKFVNKVPVPKCLNTVLVSAICHSQFQWKVREHLLNRFTQK